VYHIIAIGFTDIKQDLLSQLIPIKQRNMTYTASVLSK